MPARRPALRFDTFVVALLAAALLATVWPASGQTYDVLRVISLATIALLFFIYGVRLSTPETIAGLTNWKAHTAILAATFVAFPLAGLALRAGLEPSLGAGLAAGLLFLCVVPTTVQSNVVCTRIANGDTALAVVAASLSSIVGVFVTPALVALLLATHAEVSGESVLRIVVQFLLPFVLGQLARPLLGTWVKRNDPWLKHVDRSGILLVVYLAFSAGMTAGVWSRVSWAGLIAMIAVCAALLGVACIGLAGLGRVIGLSRPARIAVLFCGSNKSLATGLPMAAVLFPPDEVALTVLPLMIYHQLQIIAGGVIATRMAQRAVD